MSFPLFHRPGTVVFLDDDPDYLEMLALVLPRSWHLKLFLRPSDCISYLMQEPPFWEADAWNQQQLVDHAGQPIGPFPGPAQDPVGDLAPAPAPQNGEGGEPHGGGGHQGGQGGAEVLPGMDDFERAAVGLHLVGGHDGVARRALLAEGLRVLGGAFPVHALGVDRGVLGIGAFRGLPARQREVFALRYLEGCSTEETAQTLGLSTGSVKTHLFRAVHHMRASLRGAP